MTKEDYVSFEVAELLKNKGFDEYCRAIYAEGETEIEITDEYWRNTDSDIREIDDEDDDSFVFITAPTIQMAMKWLREVHNIFIQVELYSKYNDYCFELFQNTHRLILKQHETYNSYEEAVEAALEYTLKKLL